MANEHDLMAAEPRQAALDGRIVAEMAVAVQFAEFPADHFDVIPEQRPLRMPGDLYRLPGAEIVVGLAKQRGVIAAKLAKLFGIIHLGLLLASFQLANLVFQL